MPDCASGDCVSMDVINGLHDSVGGTGYWGGGGVIVVFV